MPDMTAEGSFMPVKYGVDVMELAVVIPVFNGAATLKRAVESVCASTLFAAGRVSVVIVDDGSTDETPEIAKKLAGDSGRVELVHSPHGGEAVARNLGMSVTPLEYVTFLDADDYVSPDFYERALSRFIERRDCGLAIAGFRRVDARSETDIMPPSRLVSKDALPNELVALAQLGVVNPVWNKIYRTDVIRRHGLSFEAGRIIAVDLLFNLDYLAVCGDVLLVDLLGIFYVTNSESVTNQRVLHYDPELELDSNAIYRSLIAAKLDHIGVPADSVSTYFRNHDDVWFRSLVKNLFAPGTPYNLREKIRKVRIIMEQQPQRANITSGVSSSNLAKLNRLLYRANSATLAAVTYRWL